MKSKFMRMVGRGVEEEHEDLQIEEEKELVLPLISDAEIDGFYEKFLSTGFDSPFIYDKRMYVLDMFLQVERFNKLNEDRQGKLSGGKKFKHKRLIGGVTEFENILSTIKDNPNFGYLFNGIETDKKLEQFDKKNIETVITNIKNKLKEYETTEEDKEYSLEQSTLFNELKNLLQRLEDAQYTNVYPDEDILDVRKYNKLPEDIKEKIEEEDTEIFSKYKVPAYSIKKIMELRNDIGIDPLSIDSSKIMKTLQNFKEETQINNFVTTLDYVIRKEKEDENISDTYITNLIDKVGIEINDDLKKMMKNYMAKEQGDIPKNIWDKIKKIKDEFKRPDKNFFKLLMKEMFIKTLKNPLIGNIYFDTDGKINKSPGEIIKIFEERKKFVDESKLKVYPYDETKELGNIYEIYEGMVYAENIALLIKRDVYEKTFNLDLATEVGNRVYNALKNNGKSLNVIYGFYTADIKRVDTKVIFNFEGIDYTINIETKFSGNITSINDIKTINNKASKENLNYPFVYTGIRKIMLLIKEHLSSFKEQDNYVFDEKKKISVKQKDKKRLPTTFSYNTMYYKNERKNKIFDLIKTENTSFNIKPTDASILNIQNFCDKLNITLKEVEKFQTEKKRGAKKKEEEEENDEEGDNDNEEAGVDDNAIWNFLEKKFKEANNNSTYGGIYRFNNSIYFGIPVLYELGVSNSLNTKKGDIQDFKYKLPITEDMYNYIHLKDYIENYKKVSISRKTDKNITYEKFKLPPKYKVEKIPLFLKSSDEKELNKKIFLKPTEQKKLKKDVETETSAIDLLTSALSALPPVEQQKQTKPSSIELMEQALISKQKEPPKTTQRKSKKIIEEDISTGFTPTKEQQYMIDVVEKKYKNDPLYKALFMSNGEPIPGMEPAIFTAYNNLMEHNKKVEAIKKGTNLGMDIIKNLSLSYDD